MSSFMRQWGFLSSFSVSARVSFFMRQHADPTPEPENDRYAAMRNLRGEELKEALHEFVSRNHEPVPYSWEPLIEVDQVGGLMPLIYSSESAPIDNHGGDVGQWNR